MAFKWPKDIRLQAVTAVTVMLPGAILGEGQAIGSVVDAPGDAPMGFDRSPDGKGIDSIRVVLKADQSMAIKRSSMAIVSSDQPGPIRFWVLKG